MNRYLLFAWERHEQGGGWNDFEAGFDTISEAMAHWHGMKRRDDFCIVDTAAEGGPADLLIAEREGPLFETVPAGWLVRSRYGRYGPEVCMEVRLRVAPDPDVEPDAREGRFRSEHFRRDVFCPSETLPEGWRIADWDEPIPEGTLEVIGQGGGKLLRLFCENIELAHQKVAAP